MRRGPGGDVDELHHRIGPHEVVVEGVLIGEHALRQALADDDHRLAIPPVGFVEIAAGDDGDAKRGEEARRDVAHPPVGIFFARRAHAALHRELESGTEVSRVPPRNHHAHCHAIHTGQLGDAAYGLLVEVHDLIGRLSVSARGHVQREHMAGVEAGLDGLESQ
jgi:hypothetical protein